MVITSTTLPRAGIVLLTLPITCSRSVVLWLSVAAATVVGSWAASVGSRRLIVRRVRSAVHISVGLFLAHASRRVRVRVIVVIDASTSLAIATSGSTKSIELSVELSLRLDERAAIVTHRLVAGIGVLREQSVAGGNKDHDQEDKGEDDIDDEEDDTDNTSYNSLVILLVYAVRITRYETYRLVENFGEDE